MDTSREFDRRLRKRAAGESGRLGPGEQEELRRRIRKMRDESRHRAQSAAIIYRRDIPHSGAGPSGERRVPGPSVPLEEAVSGAEAIAPNGDVVYVIEERLGPPSGRWCDLCEAYHAALLDPGSGLRRHFARLPGIESVRPQNVIFLDLETTGLGSSPLFLIGTLVWEEGGLIVRQFLARDYSEERAALSFYMRSASGRNVIVSFNGKSFDVPYVRIRAAANAVPYVHVPAHMDLLHMSRRVWRDRDRFPNHKLITLERRVCGRSRRGDIPGAEIPDAYHAFVRTGNAREIAEVVRHNRLDLITLADLLVRLPREEPR